MDRMISALQGKFLYRVGDRNTNIICYADDAVLLTDTEDNLQRLLHQYNITGKKYNMRMSTNRTKTMMISKQPFLCKLEDGRWHNRT